MDKIPQIFESKDTVYHYCSLNVALEHILYDKQLRLSKRKSSLDPIENETPFISIGGMFGSFEESQITAEEGIFIRKLENKIIDFLSLTKQSCFCMNDDSEYFSGFMVKPYEYYGFLKPRMWNQYADNYRGVCLAFSRNELEKIDTIVPKKIKYHCYSRLSLNHISINLNRLRKIGFESYEKEYLTNLEKVLFQKHIDYKGENEFRLCMHSKNEFEYIYISTAIVGIILSDNYTSHFSKQALNKFAEELKINLLYLSWSNIGISIENKKDRDKLHKSLRLLSPKNQL